MTAARGAGGARFAGCCNLCSLILLIVATSSPYMLAFVYQYQYTTSSINYNWNTLGVGTYIASAISASSSNSTIVSTNGSVILSSQGGVVWTYWSELENSNICADSSSDAYVDWALPYGFCEQGVSHFVKPYELLLIQASITTATIMIAVASLFSFLSTAEKYGTFAYSSACCSCGGSVLCIVSFSIWTAWGYSKSLRSAGGGYVPVVNAENMVVVVRAPTMDFGGAYASVIFSFIVSLFCSMVMCVVARDNRRDEAYYAGL